MTLDEFMDVLTLDDCINLLGGQPNTGCANTFGMGIFRNTESRM